MGKIETQIKIAFDKFKRDGNLLELIKGIADVGDRSIRCKYNTSIMYDAIRQYCPVPVFECVYYDGENGGYHLFDFDPNGLNDESVRIKVRGHLQRECHIDPDDIDKAMESVYLINTNTMVKVI